MPSEHAHLAAAAQRKSESAVARARSALRLLHDSGADVSFAAVAHHAGVSRQWLYKNADLRSEIEKLRGRQTGVRRVPAAQRASDASLRQRSALLIEENKRLRRNIMELQEELAQLHGERRVSALTRVTHRTGRA